MQSLTKAARVYSEKGEPLGMALVLEADRKPIKNVLKKISKGLYFPDTGQMLLGDEHERFISPPLDEATKGAKRFELGNGVVMYWRNTIKDDPTASLTWLRFYNDKLFLICTCREEMISKEDKPL